MGVAPSHRIRRSKVEVARWGGRCAKSHRYVANGDVGDEHDLFAHARREADLPGQV